MDERLVERLGERSGERLVLRLGPMIGSHGWVPRLGFKAGS